jgi:tRNA threonylcarbamoyladenosine biosynthesis protein TsaB
MSGETKYILAVDTATPCSTVALTCGTRKDGKVLAILSLSSNVTHSRRLLSSIDRLLVDTGIAKDEISGYAVGLGPGSFTGLRIGMATAKGLAAAAGVPLYGVSTLDVISANCTDTRLICVVLDARKKEVYASFYRCDETGMPRRVSDIVAVSPELLADRIKEPVLMVGDGLTAYSELWRSVLGEKLSIAPAQLWSPSAATLGLLAAEDALNNTSLDIASAVPLYVRASDAELNLQMKRQKNES